MKNTIIAKSCYAVFLALVSGSCFINLGQTAVADTTQGDQTIYAWTPANIDVDVLASREKKYQDLYPKIRDDALNTYAQAHPGSHPYDDDAKKLIKLVTYPLSSGETLTEKIPVMPLANQLALKSRSAGGDDPIISMASDIGSMAGSNKPSVGSIQKDIETFAGTSYPDIFKDWCYRAAISHLSRTLKEGSTNPEAAAASLSELPGMVQKWGQIYGQLIKKPLPNSLLFFSGHTLLTWVSRDEHTLNLVHEEIDRAFADAPDSSIQQVLDGEYLTDEAWIARSSDVAKNVNDQQWAQFKSYLDKADAVLESAYAKHPEETGISVLMLKVELGQGQGRDRMEQWFKRAIQTDPEDATIYAAKVWYLQPRWYGSEMDLVNFGQEYLNEPDPPAASLIEFVKSIAIAWEQDPDIYKKDEVWQPVEKAYRQLLSKYPQSTLYRTGFAKHAAQSERWDIVKEQFDLMGDNWNRQILTEADHAVDITLINAHAGPKTSSP